MGLTVTLGGKLTYQYVNKRAGTVKCGDCGISLNGVRQYTRPA